MALKTGIKRSSVRQMRITGGRARGIPLKAGAARDLRPATDRMREALFSSLGPRVNGARVLDLFAGTGAYGLEALSRGARSVVFVEQNRRTLADLEQNVQAVCRSLGMVPEGLVDLLAADAFSWRAACAGSFDLIFADPPYAGMGRAAEAVVAIAQHGLQPDAESRLCLEMPGEFERVLPGFELLRRVGKGRGQPTVGIFGFSD